MKILVCLLISLFVLLSYRIIFGDGSLQELSRLHKEVRHARAELVRLKSRNRNLQAEVADLKNGLEAIEERARIELGMIGNDETFFQFVRSPAPEGAKSEPVVADHLSDTDASNSPVPDAGFRDNTADILPDSSAHTISGSNPGSDPGSDLGKTPDWATQ